MPLQPPETAYQVIQTFVTQYNYQINQTLKLRHSVFQFSRLLSIDSEVLHNIWNTLQTVISLAAPCSIVL